MNWTEMDTFKGVDLSDSFVLSWESGTSFATFYIEASLWPGSTHYESPNKDEHTCYKPARLSFVNAKKISGLKEMDQAKSSTDATGEKDYGNVDALQKTDKGFSLEGDFGSVTIDGGELKFEIDQV